MIILVINKITDSLIDNENTATHIQKTFWEVLLTGNSFENLKEALHIFSNNKDELIIKIINTIHLSTLK